MPRIRISPESGQVKLAKSLVSLVRVGQSSVELPLLGSEFLTLKHIGSLLASPLRIGRFCVYSQRLKNNTPVQAVAQAATVEAWGFLECDIQLPTKIWLMPIDEEIGLVVFLTLYRLGAPDRLT